MMTNLKQEIFKENEDIEDDELNNLKIQRA
jgi:hypothetical protein